MSLKAAECGLMLPFAMHCLTKFGGRGVFGPYLYQAGASLMSVLTIIRGHRVLVPEADRQLMITHMDMHIRCCIQCHIQLTPKHHLTVHMIFRRVSFRFRGVSNANPPRPNLRQYMLSSKGVKCQPPPLLSSRARACPDRDVQRATRPPRSDWSAGWGRGSRTWQREEDIMTTWRKAR